jgi:hypothetical protein
LQHKDDITALALAPTAWAGRQRSTEVNPQRKNAEHLENADTLFPVRLPKVIYDRSAKISGREHENVRPLFVIRLQGHVNREW